LPNFTRSYDRLHRYYDKYGPVEGNKDRKSVREFLQQSIVMCSSCRCNTADIFNFYIPQLLDRYSNVCSRLFSLRYMECADVDMSLCVSQFSGAPLDDALPPSSSPTNPAQPSSPAWKGEAGIQNCFLSYRHVLLRSSRSCRGCYVRQQWAARPQVPIA
jgi:hypothetical protein